MAPVRGAGLRPAPGLGLVLAAFLLVTVAGSACSSKDSLSGIAKNADVVVITLDTVRADRVGGYGYDQAKTPGIDAFLAQAVVFEEALASRALTEPSLASMLTGLHTYQHGVVANGYKAHKPMPANLVSAMKRAGYSTHAISANGCKVLEQFEWDTMECFQSKDSRVIDAAMQVLKSESQEPKLVWIHLFAAHGPYMPGRGHAQRKFPDYRGPVKASNRVLDRLSRERSADEEDLSYLEALYDGAVWQADLRLRRVFSLLDGPLKQAVVVLSADHGEELGDHDGYFFHACSSYRAGLRVPLAIRVPGLKPRRIRHLVETRALAATILDLVGVSRVGVGTAAVDSAEEASAGKDTAGENTAEEANEIPGANLLDPESKTEAAFSAFDTYPIWTVQDRGWRLVVNPENVGLRCYPDADPGAISIQETELYRLADDPDEQVNLAADLPEQVATMRADLEAWPGYGRASQRQDLDKKTRKRLEALGYVN